MRFQGWVLNLILSKSYVLVIFLATSAVAAGAVCDIACRAAPQGKGRAKEIITHRAIAELMNKANDTFRNTLQHKPWELMRQTFELCSVRLRIASLFYP